MSWPIGQRAHNFKDRTGERIGFMVALEYEPSRKSWLCECVCGKKKYVHVTNVKTAKSCGCKNGELQKTHGQSKTKVYFVWKQMRDRCERPSHKGYKLYGGRGIKVCERWQDFENFIADMGSRPEGMSIDRIDSNGDYEPSNCRWATDTEQGRNTSRVIQLTFQGQTKPLTEWADLVGLNPRSLWARIFTYGWSVDRAITEPCLGRGGRRVARTGEQQ